MPDAQAIVSKYIEASTLLLTLDLAGTAVFAISGAAVGVKHRLDVFGVCVLAFVAGLSRSTRNRGCTICYSLRLPPTDGKRASRCAATAIPDMARPRR